MLYIVRILSYLSISIWFLHAINLISVVTAAYTSAPGWISIWRLYRPVPINLFSRTRRIHHNNNLAPVFNLAEPILCHKSDEYISSLADSKISGTHLFKWMRDNSFPTSFMNVILSIAEASKEIYLYLNSGKGKDGLLKESEKIILGNLARGNVSTASSSSDFVVRILNNHSSYSVAFEPPYENNEQLGATFGIWKGSELLGKSGSDINGAVMLKLDDCNATLCISSYRSKFSHIFKLDIVNGTSYDWIGVKSVSSWGKSMNKQYTAYIERFPISDESRSKFNEFVSFVTSTDRFILNMAENNTRCMGYTVCKLMDEEGGLIVFSNFGGPENNQFAMKLLHVAIPIAYVIENAGGYSTNGLTSILNLKALSLKDSTNGGFGNTQEIMRYKELVGPPVSSIHEKYKLENNEISEDIGKDNSPMLIMANPRGFCEGVKRAVDTVEEALRIWGRPIYVKHEIVHNEVVCNTLREKGAIFVEDLEEVPEGSVLVYSAHGIPPEVREIAKKRKLYEVDATCPLVSKVHVYVKKAANDGYHILLIGHKDHVEVIGTKGEAPDATTVVETVADVEALTFGPDSKLFYTTQTTLSLDDCEEIVGALKQKYPQIKSIPSGSICYATTNRQTALKKLAPNADVTFVIGSKMSSNAKRLVETSAYRGTKAYLINHPDDIKAEWLTGVKVIALTSSASTPETTVVKIVEHLKSLGVRNIQEFFGVDEKLPNWRLPRNLEKAAAKYDSEKVSSSS